MTLTHFCKIRELESQTVRRYIERHSEEFIGKTGRKGREITLSLEAVEILEKKYPLPKPIEVIVDHEARDELIKAQKLIISLQQQIVELQKTAALAEVQQLLLDDKEKQLSDLSEENSRLKNRGLFARILNK